MSDDFKIPAWMLKDVPDKPKKKKKAIKSKGPKPPSKNVFEQRKRKIDNNSGFGD